jgi:hypothetical protein
MKIVCTYRGTNDNLERYVGVSQPHETDMPAISEKVLRIYEVDDDGGINPYSGPVELGDSCSGTTTGPGIAVNGVWSETS